MFQVTLSGEISGQLIENNLSIWMEAKSGVLETERGHQKERREVTNTATAGTVFPEACLGLPAFSPFLPTIACGRKWWGGRGARSRPRRPWGRQRWRRRWTVLPGASRGSAALRHLDLGRPASGTAREYISPVSIHRVCGSLLQPPGETTRTSYGKAPRVRLHPLTDQERHR